VCSKEIDGEGLPSLTAWRHWCAVTPLCLRDLEEKHGPRGTSTVKANVANTAIYTRQGKTPLPFIAVEFDLLLFAGLDRRTESLDNVSRGVIAPAFAGTPGNPNCFGQSVSALARQYGGLTD
jgi:hypothetical protein